MAQIDSLIARLVQSNAERAVLRADAPLQVFAGGRQTQGSLITEAQLQSSLREVMPVAQRPELDRRGTFLFPYNSPHGQFTINVNTAGDKLEVTVTPAITPAAPVQAPAPAQPRQAAPSALTGQVFCQRCGVANNNGARFCSGCGEPMAAQTTPNPAPASTNTHPQMPAQVVSGTETKKPKTGQWLALAALLAPPMGCITIPVALILLAVLAGAGLAFAPLLLAAGASFYVWKTVEMEKNKKLLSIAGILFVGLVLNGLLAVALSKNNPNSEVSRVATNSDSEKPTSPPRSTAEKVTEAPTSAPVAPAATQPPSASPARSSGVNDLKVEDWDFKRGTFGMGVVTGTIRNTGTRTFNYVQIEVTGYDATGAQVGSSLANINNLAPDGRWNFETLPMTDKAVRAKITDIKAW